MPDTSHSGTTPVEAILEPGSYNITVSLPGYRTQTRNVTLADGDDVTEAFSLVAEQANLTVTSVPTGATVDITQV